MDIGYQNSTYILVHFTTIHQNVYPKTTMHSEIEITATAGEYNL